MKAAKNDNKKTLKVAKGCSPSPCAPRVKKSRRISRKSHKITGEGEHVLAGKDKCYDSFHSTDELHVEVLHKDENIRMGLEKDGYHPYLVTHCLLSRPFLIFIGCLGIAIVYVGFLGYVCCLVFLSAFEGIGSLLAMSFVLYFRNSFEGIGMVLTLELEIKDKSRFGKILALTIGSISVIYGRYEYLRGKILDILPDYCKEAEDHLSKAVKLNPSLIDAWLCLCNCIWKKGDFFAAKNCFIHALRKGPNRKILFQLSMLVRKMVQGVTRILRSNGYSLVATFLDYQLIGYNEDSSLLTVFALLDIAMINTDLNQGLYNGYVGDIWSLGVSILELCLGRFPFSVGRQGNWASLMCAIYLILYECESHNLILGMRHKLKHTHFQSACHQGMIH